MTKYKQNSLSINSLLWLPEETEPVRMVLAYYLTDSRASLPFLREFVIKYLETELDAIKILEGVFDKAPLTDRPLKVFRGVNKTHLGPYKKLKIGERWSMRHFVGTSLNLNTSLVFSQFGGLGIILEIKIPKGTPCVLLPGNAAASYGETITFSKMMSTKTYISDEMELLLNKNVVLELVSRRKLRIAPSVDTTSQSYLQRQLVDVYTVRVVESPNIKFERTPEQLISDLKSVTFTIPEK